MDISEDKTNMARPQHQDLRTRRLGSSELGNLRLAADQLQNSIENPHTQPGILAALKTYNDYFDVPTTLALIGEVERLRSVVGKVREQLASLEGPTWDHVARLLDGAGAGDEAMSRGEAFNTFNTATSKQVYPTIIDAGLEGLGNDLLAMRTTKPRSSAEIGYYDGLTHAALWLRGDLDD